ncbi:hypothetical protein HUS70_07800 [Pandoraea nosoerga]|uniref:Uncharacterized protein n=1 Tax=Pandoraea nosoerga TaxID=2508296 RepID=A0A5E4XSW3_9BURK|nr:hypothetical protein [Pandoraea nosoerga]MBN4667557.1 hypothetical protein [Pandoraea nosoerga]MBN4674887.1 hypothetical protein [Pandoraea nosoerga]MBN4680203.1 hypothetical protein [Pandoraea nosoerga]MBN4744563.1 hypothetical protein [Pandoraea nosoerga]VVE39444.1 hypothetical protein PNO31109_04072 [Pandoraea nosoerga]
MMIVASIRREASPADQPHAMRACAAHPVRLSIRVSIRVPAAAAATLC